MEPLHPSRLMDGTEFQHVQDDTGKWRPFPKGTYYPSFTQPSSVTEAEVLGLRNFTRVNPAPVDIPQLKEAIADVDPLVFEPWSRDVARRVDRNLYPGERYLWEHDFSVSPYTDPFQDARKRLVDSAPREEFDYSRYDPVRDDPRFKRTGYNPPKTRSVDEIMRIVTKLSLLWEDRPTLSMMEVIGLIKADSWGGHIDDGQVEAALDKLLASKP